MEIEAVNNAMDAYSYQRVLLLEHALREVVRVYNDAKSYQAVQDAAYQMHSIAADALRGPQKD